MDKKHLSDLDRIAGRKVKIWSKKLTTFGEDLSCPWLRWWSQVTPTKPPRGMMLMQDWGNEKEGLAAAVGCIDESADSNGKKGDATLRNLFSSPWGPAFVTREWCISNAIWGLRAKTENGLAKKSGYLGDPIHKAFFPLWLHLLHGLCTQFNGEFTLIVAGGWAVFDKEFDNPDSSEGLQEYLRRWEKWTSRSVTEAETTKIPGMITECRGRVYHVVHPAIWRSRAVSLKDGPPELNTF